jgi:Zn-dependent M28 family amino/carboxypeptidase
LAAQYIAAQFERLGLEPVGPDGSFLLPVEGIGVSADPSLIVGVQGQTLALEPMTDFVAWPLRPDTTVSSDGELLFAGFGIHAPEWDWNDFKDSFLVGKVLLVMAGEPTLEDPTSFADGRMTFYGSWRYKVEQAARSGALGVLIVYPDSGGAISWRALTNAWSSEQFLSTDAPESNLRFAAWVRESAVKRLAAASGRDFELLERRAGLRTFEPISMGAHAVIRIRSTIRRIRAANVAARLRGSDPAGAETVILMANYDNIGIGQPINGDSIYNGAVDNASGVSLLLAAAAGLSASTGVPRRDLVFLATTASHGQVTGADAYVRRPVGPIELTVATVSLSRANLRGRTADVVGLGAEQSTLSRYLAQAAVDEGLKATPSPAPGAGEFYWMDLLPLARAGVPAMALRPGRDFPDKPREWAAEQEHSYLDGRYLSPFDEFDPAVNYEGVVQQVRVIVRLAWLLGNATDFPAWASDSEFRPAGEQLRVRRIRGKSEPT